MIKIEAKEERYLYNAYHMIKAFYASEEVEQCCKKNQKEDLKLTETDGNITDFYNRYRPYPLCERYPARA